MRIDGRRKKKLIVAFHFQRGSQAGWECGSCRVNGLERRRRCGYLSGLQEQGRPVWANKYAATTICPKSYITADSLAWIEEYLVRRRFGWGEVSELGAKKVEAFLILDRELATETRDARRNE